MAQQCPAPAGLSLSAPRARKLLTYETSSPRRRHSSGTRFYALEDSRFPSGVGRKFPMRSCRGRQLAN